MIGRGPRTAHAVVPLTRSDRRARTKRLAVIALEILGWTYLVAAATAGSLWFFLELTRQQ